MLYSTYKESFRFSMTLRDITRQEKLSGKARYVHLEEGVENVSAVK